MYTYACTVTYREITNTHEVTFVYLHNGYASMCRTLKWWGSSQKGKKSR